MACRRAVIGLTLRRSSSLSASYHVACTQDVAPRAAIDANVARRTPIARTQPACHRLFADSGCLWPRSCSLQHLPAALCRFELPRPNDPATTFFHRRPTSPAAFVLAVFIAWAIRRSLSMVSDLRITVRCVSFVADVLMCLCAVSGTQRGLSQPRRAFGPPTLMGFSLRSVLPARG